MKHFASSAFWVRYNSLSPEVKTLADRAYAHLKQDPKYPSLHFKKVGRFWSARVGIAYRALAVEAGEDLVWFWIGSHSEYEKLIN